jgi:hypothetical protein
MNIKYDAVVRLINNNKYVEVSPRSFAHKTKRGVQGTAEGDGVCEEKQKVKINKEERYGQKQDISKD